MGFYSFVFSNLHQFKFSVQKPLKNLDTSEREIDFPSLEQAIKHKFGMPNIEAKGGKRWAKSVDKIYFAIVTIWKYYEEYKTYPTIETKDNLLAIRKRFLADIDVDERVLPMDFLLEVVRVREAEIMPACAIVGGFIAQEIFKALARNEVPLCNFFCHNAVEASGIIH
jgi:ubiquitin-like 1-activating enzyme E1 A